MLESNFLAILLKPTYEKPINNAEDIIEMGFTVLKSPGMDALVEMLKNSPSSITRKIAAENTVIVKVNIILLVSI